MTIPVLDQLMIELNNPLKCNLELTKKITQQVTKLCKEPKKIQKYIRRTTATRRTKQDSEVPDSEIDSYLQKILDLSYENLFNSSRQKFDLSKRPLPFILCWSQLGLLALSNLEIRGYYSGLGLANIKWKFYYILSETNTQALKFKDCDDLYNLIQTQIDELEGELPSQSPLGSKRKLDTAEPSTEPNLIYHPVCFKIQNSENLTDSLIEAIIGYQSLKINQIVRSKLTYLLPQLNLNLDASGSPYSTFELALQRGLNKPLTQLARSYLLLANYTIDHNLLPCNERENILEISLLTYIYSKLPPISNIFTMLFKFGTPQDTDELKLLNLNKKVLKILKLRKIQLIPSDYFLPWFSSLLELIIKNSNLQTYSSLINWVRDQITKDCSITDLDRNLLNFGMLICESFVLCYSSISEKRQKCQKLTNSTITLYDKLPSLQNSIATCTDAATCLSKINATVYRLSKVIRQWLNLHSKLGSSISDNEISLLSMLIKLWTKLFSLVGTKFDKENIQKLIGKQLDSFVLSFIGRANTNQNLSTSYFDLVKCTYSFLDPAKILSTVKFLQDFGFNWYTAKDFQLAGNYFGLSIEILNNYTKCSITTDKEKNAAKAMLYSLTKSQAKLGDLTGVKNVYFDNLLEDISSTQRNSMDAHNILEITEEDPLVARIDNLTKIHHQSKNFKQNFLISNLMENLKDENLELIFFILKREIQITADIIQRGTRYELAYNLTKQLDSIIDTESFPLMKALVCLDLTQLELELSHIEILKEFSNQIDLTKSSIKEGLDPSNLLNLSKELLISKISFSNNNERELYKLLKYRLMALDYFIDLENNPSTEKIEKLLDTVLINNEITPKEHLNHIQKIKIKGTIVQNLMSQLIELLRKVIKILKLNSSYTLVKKLNYFLLSLNPSIKISLELFLDLSLIAELEGDISKAEDILLECGLFINDDREIDLEFKVLYWSKSLSHFNSKQDEERCQLSLNKISELGALNPLPNQVELIKITLPLNLSLSQYYLTIGKFNTGLELALRSLYSIYNLNNLNFGMLCNLTKVHKGDCFDDNWFKLMWKVKAIEYYEFTALALQLLIEGHTLKGNFRLIEYFLQKALELANSTNLNNLKLNFQLKLLNFKSKLFKFEEVNEELDRLIIDFKKSLNIDNDTDDCNSSNLNSSKIWEIKAKTELKEFKFTKSNLSFNRSYNWLIQSKTPIASELSLMKIIDIKNNLNEILPTSKTFTISSWYWSGLITELVLKKQISQDCDSLKLQSRELDVNLGLTLAKSEFIRGVSILDKLPVFDNLMNCYWTSPKICDLSNTPISSSNTNLIQAKTHFQQAFKLLSTLIPNCYLTNEFNTIRDIILTLSKLNLILELISSKDFDPNTVNLANNLMISKGISLSRSKLDIYLNPSQSLRSSSKWPNVEELNTNLPSFDKKLTNSEINEVIDNYSSIYNRSPDSIWSEIGNILPNEWAIASMDYCRESNDLMITRFDNFTGLKVCRLPLVQQVIVPKTYNDLDSVSGYPYELAISELERIISQSVKISKNGVHLKTKDEKIEWWNSRYKLDGDLKDLLERIETKWLGVFKGFLRADNSPISLIELQSLCNNIKELINDKSIFSRFGTGVSFAIDEGLIQNFLRIGKSITLTDCEDIVSLIVDTITMSSGMELHFSEGDQNSLNNEIFNLIQNSLNSPVDDTRKINHVILVVDNYLQHFPWESLPCLLNTSISRIPSLPILRDHLIQLKKSTNYNSKDYKGFQVNTDSTFYMLNPSKDLIRTQNFFTEPLKASGWSGVIGKSVDEAKLEKCLKASNLYLYFGHGTGENFIRSEKVQLLNSAPVAILLGCSSGKVKFQGEFEGTGAPLHYLLGNSKAVVANLWDVTDRDIDKYSHKLLALWGLENFRSLPTIEGDDVMKGYSEVTKLSLAQSLSQSRSTCVLKYLVGAAPIMYGLPIYTENN